MPPANSSPVFLPTDNAATYSFHFIHIHVCFSLLVGDQTNLFSVCLLIIELSLEQGFSNTLPEELKTGKWNVYRLKKLVQTLLCILKHNWGLILLKCRSSRSPLKLVSRFAHHPEIGTLHDNFVWVIKLAWLTPHFPFLLKKIHHNLNSFSSFLFWFVCLVRRSVEAFPDCNYVGSRVQEDGTVGEYVSHWKPVIELMIYLQGILIQCNILYRYKWMTYKEADTARSAIGSALVCHQIPKATYFINFLNQFGRLSVLFLNLLVLIFQKNYKKWIFSVYILIILIPSLLDRDLVLVYILSTDQNGW